MVIRVDDRRVRRAAAIAVLALLAMPWGAAPKADPQIQLSANKAGDGDSGRDKGWTPGPLATPYGNYLAARHAEKTHDSALASLLFERTLRHAPDDPVLIRQTLHQMVTAGRMTKAVILARRYIKIRPSSVIAGLALAIDDIRSHRFESAAKQLRAMPTGGLGGYVVPLVLSWTLAGQGQADDALEALAPFGKRRGLTAIHDLHAASILDVTGETSRAEELFEKITKGKRLHTRLVELSGAFFERQGNASKARALYEKFLSDARGIIAVEMALARAKRSADKPAKDIASAADGAAEALLDLAMILNDQNVDEIALMLTRMALHLRPRFALAQMLVGDILLGMRRYGDAAAAYDKVAPASPRSWQARLRAADTLSRMDKIQPALARLSAMAKERSGRPDALIAAGDILRFKKRYDEALKDYDQAFSRISKIERRHWSLFYSRAISLERSKRWKRAEKDFIKALELQPNQPFVLNYLGYSWVDRGEKLKRALGMIEKAVRLRPNDGFIVDSLGWAHYRLGGYAKAVKYLERAATLSPQDAAINDHLGDAYWRVGRRTEARFQWRRALGLDPEPEILDGVRKKLAEGMDQPPRKSETSGDGSRRRGG
jgi:tetratricopeptide (TPR) repeat protein